MTTFTHRQQELRCLLVVMGIVIGVGMLEPLLTLADEEETAVAHTTPHRTTTRHGAKKPASESSETSSDPILKRLNEILDNQKTILANQQTIFQKFDAVMEELRIVKVRATLHGGGS